MKILVIGSEGEFNLVKSKIGDAHDYEHVEDVSLALQNFDEQELVIDFLIEDYPDNIDAYKDIKGLTVLLNTPKITLAELRFYHPDISCRMIGFNGLPGFFQNDKWELTILSSQDKPLLEQLFNKLNQQYFVVKDRVGMVSPRVVCMIINEAFFTVQEGTASREDIDLGMKLGTNYPYGPFEWVERIGVNHVYELLEALYDDTKDERYKICPLLKSEYLSYSSS